MHKPQYQKPMVHITVNNDMNIEEQADAIQLIARINWELNIRSDVINHYLSRRN